MQHNCLVLYLIEYNNAAQLSCIGFNRTQYCSLIMQHNCPVSYLIKHNNEVRLWSTNWSNHWSWDLFVSFYDADVDDDEYAARIDQIKSKLRSLCELCGWWAGNWSHLLQFSWFGNVTIGNRRQSKSFAWVLFPRLCNTQCLVHCWDGFVLH